MALRPLLSRLQENPDGAALIRDGGRAFVSQSLRPYVVAALADSTSADRPTLVVAGDDRQARDMAADLRAWLRPRPVRFYPSRGVAYESHLAPPPHLVGLRIGALDALQASSRAAGGAAEGSAVAEAPVVVASAVALAEVVPDASLRPEGFVLHRGEEVDLDDVAELLVEAGYEYTDQVGERGQFAVRGGILDVFPATEERAARLELFGDEIESVRWFSTFTQRSLGEADRIELAPAAELALEHRQLAEQSIATVSGNGADEDRALHELLPLERFRAPLDLLPAETAIVLAGAEDIEPALRDHWEDVTTAIHDEDARRLYVEVSGPLRERAALSLRSTGDAGGEEGADAGPHLFRAQ